MLELQFYSISQMGIQLVAHPPIILLSADFLSRVLNISISSVNSDPHIKKSALVGCPLCKKGNLQLVESNHTYYHGDPISPSQEPTSGNYLFECSSKKCYAIFRGDITWVHIN